MVPTVEDDVGIEETVWNAVHGPATEEGKKRMRMKWKSKSNNKHAL